MLNRAAFALFVLGLVGCSKTIGQQGAITPAAKRQADEVKSTIRTEIFEPVYRVAMELKSGQELGMNRAKFGELIQRLSTEVAIAKDKAESAEEQKIADGYSQVLDIYKDAAALWDVELRIPDYKEIADESLKGQEIEGSAKRILMAHHFELATIQGIPIDLYPDGSTGIEKIIEMYNLPVQDEEGFRYTPRESIQIIWSKAREKNDEVDKLRKSSSGA